MIDIDQVRKLSPKDGDVFALPAEATEEFARELVASLMIAAPGLKCSVVLGSARRYRADP
jgi:hypothetical protein